MGPREELQGSAPPPAKDSSFGSVLLRILAIPFECKFIYMYRVGVICHIHLNMSAEFALVG